MTERSELLLAAKAGLDVLKRLIRHSDKRRSGGFYVDIDDVVRLEEIESEARLIIKCLEAAGVNDDQPKGAPYANTGRCSPEIQTNSFKWGAVGAFINDATQSTVNEADKVAQLMQSAATAMRDACVEKVKAMRDEWRREADSREEFQFANDRLKRSAQANAADWIITALESLTLHQVEQEKQS